MADYLKRNLMQLRNNNPVVKENFEHTEKMIEIQKKKDQHNIYLKEGRLYFVYEDKEYRLASIEPKKEAEYMIRNLESMKDHLVVVFGMANIELLKKLLLDTTKNTKIAVFEPNNDVFLYCMKNYNLCDMIASPKFGFLIGDKPMLDREIPVYFNSSWMNLVHNIQVIAIPNYYIYKEFMADVMKRISSEIDSALLCLGNSLPDMMDGLVNHYLNVDASIEASDCRELEGSYEGIPAIVVASGPSLDKNIDDLKLAQGKALILACDASYQICIEHGIQPDAIVSLERGEPTYNAFYKGRTFDDKLVLIGPSLLWPKIHEEFPGKQLLYAKNHTGLEGWWMDIFPNSQYASLGHSCATAAYAVARKAGCDPVILIGQDLAYTDDKKHSDRVHSDSFQTDNELTEEEKESKDLWVEDIYGGKVRTSETFNLFRHYFEDAALAKGTMIDATEGGALIRGTKVMTLKEAIERYCGKDLEKKLYELLSDRPITSQERLEKYNKVIEKTEGMLDLLREIQKRAVNHYKELEKYQDFPYDTASEDELVEVILDMKKGDELLEFFKEEGEDAHSFYQQILRQTIIYVKKIGNEITGKTIKRNWELQVNLMQMIDIASVSVGNEMERMLKMIKHKKDKLEEAIAGGE